MEILIKSIAKALRKYWILLLLSFISFIIVWPTLMPGYFSHHDDLQVMRIYEIRRCFEDLQIPCRWVPDMGYGNGFPLYNYYSALPYYIGGLLSYIFGFIGAAKLLFLLPLVIGLVSMYYLARELFGDKLAVVAAVLYALAPYRALDSYVRGAVAESFALAIIPLVFYFSLKLVKSKKRNDFLGFSLSLSALLLTHNIMTIIFLPFLIIWTIYYLFEQKFKSFKVVVLATLLGFGLASFFLFPAFLEKDLVQTETLLRGDLDFRANFVTINQLFFSRFWGYGASVPGTEDMISFQIGWPHWWLVFISASFVAYQTIKSKKKNIFFYFLFVVFLFSILMTHNKSAFIWEKLPILHYAQFPWRFLSLTIFAGSLLSVFFLQALKGKLQVLIIGIIILITIILNASLFKPEIFYTNMTDQEKLSGFYFEQQQRAAILDYLPNGIPEPESKAPDKPIIVLGAGEVNNFENHSNRWQFQANINQASTVEVPVFNFPNWTVYVDGKKVKHSDNNYLKRIMLNLDIGSHLVVGRFENTPFRTFGNIATILALISIIIIYGKNRKIFK